MKWRTDKEIFSILDPLEKDTADYLFTCSDNLTDGYSYYCSDHTFIEIVKRIAGIARDHIK